MKRGVTQQRGGPQLQKPMTSSFDRTEKDPKTYPTGVEVAFFGGRPRGLIAGDPDAPDFICD